MSFSSEVEKHRRAELAAVIEREAARIALMLKKDLRAIEASLESGSKPKTRGKYSKHESIISYKVKIAKWVPTQQLTALKESIETVLRDKEHLAPLLCLSSDSGLDFRVTTSVGDNEFCSPLHLFHGDVFLTVEADFKRSPDKRFNAYHTNNEAYWPVAALLPEACGGVGGRLQLVNVDGLDEDVALDLTADAAKKAEAALASVKTKAAALHDFVVDNFDRKSVLGFTDKVKGRADDHYFKQHIAALRKEAGNAPDARATVEDFIKVSTSAFWLGRAWQASEEAATKTGKARIAAYVRMREHLRTSWFSVTSDIDQDMPFIMREAEVMPTAVMRAVRARYDAAWRAQDPQDVIGGYVAGTVGLRTSLDKLAGVAKASFDAAAKQQATRLAERHAPARRGMQASSAQS